MAAMGQHRVGECCCLEWDIWDVGYKMVGI